MSLSSKAKMLKTLIENANGKFFHVVHKRKNPKKLEDGSLEHYNSMTCRTGVTKDLKGGVSTIEHKKEDGLISVTKMEGKEKGKPQYRAFYLDDVKEISIVCGNDKVELSFKDV